MHTPQILFDETRHVVHLTNGCISYVMEVVDGRYLVHRYFGPALRSWHGAGCPVYFKRGYNTCHDDCTVPTNIDDSRLEWARQAAIRYAER